MLSSEYVPEPASNPFTMQTHLNPILPPLHSLSGPSSCHLPCYPSTSPPRAHTQQTVAERAEQTLPPHSTLQPMTPGDGEGHNTVGLQKIHI